MHIYQPMSAYRSKLFESKIQEFQELFSLKKYRDEKSLKMVTIPLASAVDPALSMMTRSLMKGMFKSSHEAKSGYNSALCLQLT